MKNLKNFIFPLLISLFIASVKCTHSITNTNTVNNCPIQQCTYNKNDLITPYVQFPFTVRNNSLPNSCGYSGFDLVCGRTDNNLLVDFPNSEGVFSVQAIDYIEQEIRDNDPNNCLPRMLLSFNLSNFDKSPFTPVLQSRKEYWLYNCSIDYFELFGITIKPISCLSSSTYGVAAYPSKLTNNVTTSLCNYLGTIKLPIGSQTNTVESSDLSRDIRLSWVEPWCSECYREKGRCGLKSYSSVEVGCFDVPRQGLRQETIVALALGIAIPLTLITCCMTYLALRSISPRASVTTNNTSITVIPAAMAAPHPEPIGLERSIIESYPKVVLGESRRLPLPEEKSCPICLGEYLAMETLRTIPDCAHCFHAYCIDEWLESNASCPVCRYIPSCSLDIGL